MLNALVVANVATAATPAAAYNALNQAAVANKSLLTDPSASVLFYNAMKEALDPAGTSQSLVFDIASMPIDTTHFLRVAAPERIAAAGITTTKISYPNFTDGSVIIDLPDVIDSTVAYLNKCPVGYSIIYRHGAVPNRVSRTVTDTAAGLLLDGSPYVLGTPIAFDGTFTYTIWAQGSNQGSGSNGSSSPVPCFTKGTMIRVPSGEVAVETLKAGDLVTTADGRTVAIKGLYKTRIAATTKETAPYLIPAGTYGSAQPRDLLLSSKHAIQIRKGVWNFPGFATQTNPAIRQIAVGEAVDYYHLECPVFLRDNLIANGCVVESFGTLQIKHNPYTYSARLGGFTRQGGFTRKMGDAGSISK